MQWKLLPPREVAAAMLARLFSSPQAADAPTRSSFALANHQARAVVRSRRILLDRRGVLVADEVGLGKTYVALALAEEELKRDGRVLVVVPAALLGAWEAPLARLVESVPCGAVWTATHTGLSRGSAPSRLRGRRGAGGASRSPPPDGPTYTLVVVDEAHRFRNPATRRYAALAHCCVGSGVVLVTATPINNHVHDLHHLLRLFAADGAFRDLGVSSLAAAFDAAVASSPDSQSAYVASGAPAQLKRVLDAVMVRRTRASLRQSTAAKDGSWGHVRAKGDDSRELTFPQRDAPQAHRYREPRLRRLADLISELEMPAYTAVGAGGDGSALVRLGLLKRLDSSLAAARASLEAHAAFASCCGDAARAGRLLRPREGWWSATGDGDPHQLVLLEMVADPAPPSFDLIGLQAALQRDIARLSRALQLLGPDGGEEAKLSVICDLCERLAHDKVVIFTEFRDTAQQIWRALLPRARVGRVDGGGAWLGERPAGRAAVLQRFAPRAYGRAPPHPSERVDVLVATDVLSEGLNLQDARHVVSYDLPWNPIRLLQRIGRVDRLGSAHARVSAHLFVPAEGVDELLRLTRVLRQKLTGIVSMIGGDGSDGLLERLMAGGELAAGALNELRTARVEPLELLRLEWETTPGERRGCHGGRPASPAPVEPIRVGILCCEELMKSSPASPASPALPQALVLAQVMGRARLLELDPVEGCRVIGHPGVAALRDAWMNGRDGSAPMPGEVWGLRGRLEEVSAAVAGFVAAQQLEAGAPAPLERRDPARRLVTRLKQAAAAEPALPPEMVARVQNLLTQLSQPLHPALESAAEALLREGAETLNRLVDDLEGLLAAAPHRAGAAPEQRAVPGVEAASARAPVPGRFAPSAGPAAAVSGSPPERDAPDHQFRVLAVLFLEPGIG